MFLVPDDPEGIHSRDQGQPRTSPPKHLNLAGIVHILDCPDIPWPKIAPFILHVDQFNDRPGIILLPKRQNLLTGGKRLIIVVANWGTIHMWIQYRSFLPPEHPGSRLPSQYLPEDRIPG